MSILRTLALIVFALNGTAVAEWQADAGDATQLKAQTAMSAIREKIPRSGTYFDEAWGYAVYPSVTRVGFGFGGAWGKGIVIEQGSVVGSTSFWQFTSGIQAGARNFSMIVFFKDKEALEYFKSEETQFMGQAGLALATAGIAGTPAYNHGVAIVTMTRLGIMGEFTISGAKFTFRPATGAE